jgi:hypothetical protein
MEMAEIWSWIQFAFVVVGGTASLTAFFWGGRITETIIENIEQEIDESEV